MVAPPPPGSAPRNAQAFKQPALRSSPTFDTSAPWMLFSSPIGRHRDIVNDKSLYSASQSNMLSAQMNGMSVADVLKCRNAHKLPSGCWVSPNFSGGAGGGAGGAVPEGGEDWTKEGIRIVGLRFRGSCSNML